LSQYVQIAIASRQAVITGLMKILPTANDRCAISKMAADQVIM